MGHLVQRGDMWRKEGFRDLFGVVELRSLDEARDKLLAACESYLEAAEAIEVVHIAQLVNDRCTYDLPKMVSWAYQSLGASPNQAVDPLRLVETPPRSSSFNRRWKWRSSTTNCCELR